MKNIVYVFLVLSSSFAMSQENPEVYVFDISPVYEGLQLLNVQNVSNNVGYDNQPSFISNEALVFAGNNDGQTDISKYDLTSNHQSWLNLKTEGGEYSPQMIPSTKDFAAVRLDKDGLQRLYRYNSEGGNSHEMIENLQVAYFAYANDNTILATILNGEEMDLVKINLLTKSGDTLLHNAGRSIHKIPKINYMSYTSVNEDKNLDIFMMNIATNESFFICQLPIGVQDYVWLSDSQMLLGSNNRLYLFDTLGPQQWVEVASLEEFGITDISRMAVSPNGKKLAVVGIQE